MFKGISANRMSKIKVCESGKVVKTVSSASINYGQDFDQLRKMIEIAIRLSPQDPIYNIEKVFVVTSEGDEVEVDQQELELIQASLCKQDACTSMTSKISLVVHAKKPSTRSVSRLARDNLKSVDTIEISENQENKCGNLRQISPSRKFVTTTPQKSYIRSISRGKHAIKSNTKPLFAENEHSLTKDSFSVSIQSLVEKVEDIVDEAKELKMNSIQVGIDETWKEVDGYSNIQTPPRTFLSPFKYYSPDDGASKNDAKSENICIKSQSQNDTAQLLKVDEIKESILNVEESTKSFDTDQHNNKDIKIPVVAEAQNNPSTPAANIRSQQPAQTRKNLPSTTTPISKQNRAKTPTSTMRRSTLLESTKVGFDVSHPPENAKSHTAGNRTPTDTPRSSRKKAKDEFTTLFAKQTHSSNDDDCNRPSIGTIKSQWEFMRNNFFNNSDEDLEWLMVSKRAGAYSYAHKKNETAEDKYFKSLYEIDYYETKLKFFVGINAKLPLLIGDIASYYSTLMATPNNESALEMLSISHNKLVEYMKSQENNKILEVCTSKFEQLMTTMLNETEEKFKIARKARDLHQSLPQEILNLQSKLTLARKDCDEALKNMEKWSKREIETIDYASVMKQQEETFMSREFRENTIALEIMRTVLPANIFDISTTELQEIYSGKDGYVSLELSQELKSNKLLHWLVTHPDDIVFSNFLSGEQKAFFENIESLDIIEMRAISLVIPNKFELDSDGRKLEWRSRFFTRFKQLVAQVRREKVKGCWDPTKNCRQMVELPSLKPDQIRRSIYFHRTKEQSNSKLKQYDDKLALLQKKKGWFTKAEKEAKEAKEEYDTVLKEMRDPDFIELYGTEKLSSVKDMAKIEWTNCEQKRKILQQEVNRLEKAINEAPLNRDQFINKENELKEYLRKRGVDWESQNLTPFEVEGVFEKEQTLQKRVKPAAKFLSAEQDALERKMELANLKPRQNFNSIIEESCEMVSSTDDDKSLDESILPPFIDHSDLNQLNNSIIANAEDCQQYGISCSNNSFEETNPLPCARKSIRKHSILMHTNPELLGTLNKMFSNLSSMPAGSSMIRSSRRSTISISTLNKAPSEKPSDKQEVVVVLKEAKVSKSKLLQRLMNPFSSSQNVVVVQQPTDSVSSKLKPLSFLDQIRNRASNGESCNNTSTGNEICAESEEVKSKEVGTEIPPAIADAPSKPKMFDRLGLGGGMSFLDQIKSRRKDIV